MVIGNHAISIVFLWIKYDLNGTRAEAFTYLTVADELLYLPLDLLSFLRVDAVGSLVRKRSSKDEVNSVLNAS